MRQFLRYDALYFDRELVPEAARAGSAYYQDYCPRHDVAFHGGWASTTDGGPIYFAFFRGKAQGEFTGEDRRKLARLAPAAGRAARLLVEGRRVQATGMALGFEAAGKPCLIVNHDGRVGFVTRAAAALFDSEFGVQRGALWAADSESRHGLALLSAAAARRVDDRALPNVLVRRATRRPIVLLPSPVRGVGLDALPGARLIVSCIDLESRAALSGELLRSLFGMTASEALIAGDLVNGASVEEIAAARALKESSVRQLIKSLLGKSGTHRQAELVALLTRLVSTNAT